MLGHLLLEDLLQNYLNAFPDPGLYASRFTLCSNSLFGVKRLPPHSTHNLPDVIRLPGKRQGVGRKGVGLERRGRASYPEAHTREGRANLGGGMGKGGSKDRVAEVDAAPGLRGPAAPVGCGADVCLAMPQPQD